MKFYVYCVTEAVPKLEGALAGLEQEQVEVFVSGALSVIVSGFRKDLVPVTQENVLRHEAVVRNVFATSTVLPFRFGTLVTESDLVGYLKARESALLERFGRVRDCVEMSVKIIWPNVVETKQNPKDPDSNQPGAGTAFLLLKRQELFGKEQRDGDARQLAQWLHGGLDGVAREEQVTIEPNQRLVLAASYLVERARLSEYRRQLAKLQAQRVDLHFLASGPWPPYTFANVDLEFDTHFGVS